MYLTISTNSYDETQVIVYGDNGKPLLVKLVSETPKKLTDIYRKDGLICTEENGVIVCREDYANRHGN